MFRKFSFLWFWLNIQILHNILCSPFFLFWDTLYYNVLRGWPKDNKTWYDLWFNHWAVNLCKRKFSDWFRGIDRVNQCVPYNRPWIFWDFHLILKKKKILDKIKQKPHEKYQTSPTWYTGDYHKPSPKLLMYSVY